MPPLLCMSVDGKQSSGIIMALLFKVPPPQLLMLSVETVGLLPNEPKNACRSQQEP